MRSALWEVVLLSASIAVSADPNVEVVFGDTGVIRHPFDLGNYGDNEERTWIIRAENPIRIIFYTLNIEEHFDYLYIGDGENIQSFTGNSVPAPVRICSSVAHLLFDSDMSITETGFWIVWEPAGCGCEYTMSSGQICHPVVGGNYQNNEYCTWNIWAEIPIKITFSSFETEEYGDKLYVGDGEIIGLDVLGSFSGNTIPNPVQTISNEAYLYFTSNDFITKAGFVLSWEPADWTCSSVGGVFFGPQCLYICNEKLSWSNAVAECARTGGRLATLASNANNLLTHLNIFHYDNDVFWAGGSDIGNEGHWVWMNGEPFKEFPWEYSQPNGDSSYYDEDCLGVNDAHGYHDYPCDSNHRYICELDWCSSVGGVQFGFESQCLTFSTEKRTWHLAEVACSIQGGHLATLEFNAKDVLTYLNTMNYDNDLFWAGGCDIENNGKWVWRNGVPFYYLFPWANGQPNSDNSYEDQDCLAVNDQNGYQVCPCANSYRYICELGGSSPNLARNMKPENNNKKYETQKHHRNKRNSSINRNNSMNKMNNSRSNNNKTGIKFAGGSSPNLARNMKPENNNKKHETQKHHRNKRNSSINRINSINNMNNNSSSSNNKT